MADGSQRAIAKVDLGDYVVATDPITGDTTARQVTVLHENLDSDFTDITVMVDPDPAVVGDESLKRLSTTWHHPFFDATNDGWVEAAQLHSGHQLAELGGAVVIVVSVQNYTGSRLMYDLTVDTVHTYYVMVGGIPVLVHNMPAPEPDTPRYIRDEIARIKAGNGRPHIDLGTGQQEIWTGTHANDTASNNRRWGNNGGTATGSRVWEVPAKDNVRFPDSPQKYKILESLDHADQWGWTRNHYDPIYTCDLT
jgi:Pretoxin HINT domain